MNPEAALKKAWDLLGESNPLKRLSVRFLSHEYLVDLDTRSIVNPSTGASAEDGLGLLILHYLARRASGLPPQTGAWLSLSELSVATGFDNAFKKQAIAVLVDKYGCDPQGIYRVLERAPGRKLVQADAAIVVEVFEGVPALIELWTADDEFGPDANLLFDRNVTGIFCSEDIIVLAEAVARNL
ncbi:MAG: DUF3786 domain-containing protein [Nitrospirota bacterium]|nr:DUF3786 domain-containing protein [Nitrospirota bacterium]